MTRRWTRSPNREVFGVVAGFAEWKDLPIKETRLIVLLIILFTSVFPGLVIYLLLAIYLPMQTEEDIISPHASRSFSERRAKYRKEHFKDAFTKGKADAALAASVFHFGEIEIAELKRYLHGEGINVRL